MSARRGDASPLSVELRPTINCCETESFRRQVRLAWEDGELVAVDIDGRTWRFSGARTLVLQTDLQIGVRSLHGSNDILMVLDDQGRVLVRAHRQPFDEHHVADFCRAAGLELRRTQRTHKQPSMPPKAPGYRCLDFTRRRTTVVAAVLVATVALALLGPFHPVVVLIVGLLVSLAVLAVLAVI